MSEATGRWTAADFGGNTELFRMINRILWCVTTSEYNTTANLDRLLSQVQNTSAWQTRAGMKVTEGDLYNSACNTILECAEASDAFPSEEEWRRWDKAAEAIRNFDRE